MSFINREIFQPKVWAV